MWDVLVSVQHVSILPHYECGKTIELQHTVRVHSVYTTSNNQMICGTNTVKIYQPHQACFFQKKNSEATSFFEKEQEVCKQTGVTRALHTVSELLSMKRW